MSGAAFPFVFDSLHPKLSSFRMWLDARGSQIFSPTNPFEVLRFSTPEGIGVIYQKKSGTLSFTGGSKHALVCFLESRSWRGCTRQKLNQNERRRLNIIHSVVERDGWKCAYCGGELSEETATLEHFVSRTHGGPDHLANIVLAHGHCNAEADHLSVREKIEMIVRLRMEAP